MIIPKKVKIGGHELLVNSDSKKFSKEMGLEGLCAKTYLGGDIILINRNGICRSQQEESFLHEVIHHILFHSGWNDEAVNEPLVQSLASGLYQFLKDNKLLR